MNTLSEIQEKTAPVLRQHGVSEAYVFGSASRGEARSGSDIDLLVRFEPRTGLFEYMRIKNDLEDALDGALIDLVSIEALRPEFRTIVDREKVRIV